jgi:sRNA-binding protein
MNTNTILWLAGVVIVLVTAAQWVLLRWRYLDGLAKQRARHAQQMQTAGLHLEQARRQIAQLQLDLGNARSQLARLAPRQAVPARPTPATQAREEAHAAPRRSEPFDGFADTLPSPQYPHDPKVLTSYPARS